jgi:hypothetical protein
MMRLGQYFMKWQDVRGGLGRLPNIARLIVIFLAIPAIVLASLALVLLTASILALLLLPWPAYRLLRSVLCGGIAEDSVSGHGMFDALIVDDDPTARPRRHVDVRVVE